MKVKLTEVVELRGGEAWTEKRLELLKNMNKDGRVAVTDDKGQTFVAPIKCLEIVPE